MRQSKILVVDDDKNVRYSFRKMLRDKKYYILEASDGKQAIQKLQKKAPNLVILDVKLPEMDWLATFKKIKEINSEIPIIIMTAYGTTDIAIDAMRIGAYDYVLKPFNIVEMQQLIEKALKTSMLTEREGESKKQLTNTEGKYRVIGSSKKMQEVYKIVGRVAVNDITVLICGESGTGKELIARLIHHHSSRTNKPFIIVNCAAIPETLLESELFGYEKGAFTGAYKRKIGKFELANGGTIFLDEIGDISPNIQSKVLRVLEEGEFERVGGTETIKVNTRIIATTNRNLEHLIAENKFREDLYYRLRVATINLPPLRERREDIRELAEHFLKNSNMELKKKVKKISDEAMRILEEYRWSGNCRELENVIKRAVLLTKSDRILPEDLSIRRGEKKYENNLEELVERFKGNLLPSIERVLIVKILDKTKGNKTKAARILGIHRHTLRNKIKKYRMRTE